MCGIAGIMYKTRGTLGDTGKALIDMLDGCQHRGPDSTGFACTARPPMIVCGCASSSAKATMPVPRWNASRRAWQSTAPASSMTR